eukprot:CAMPEP_0117545782 /NCGR_PEP_ID=MMETSP0784-20121206/46274_1 /TAXON_ID=39447 /ORGANISM="" /LENGTH=144 /DNA_ID=CAMNT_0005342643 /DNA_START=547 /DNA_END=978 /DNA_ORIENTATION=-
MTGSAPGRGFHNAHSSTTRRPVRRCLSKRWRIASAAAGFGSTATTSYPSARKRSALWPTLAPTSKMQATPSEVRCRFAQVVAMPATVRGRILWPGTSSEAAVWQAKLAVWHVDPSASPSVRFATTTRSIAPKSCLRPPSPTLPP